MKIKQNTTQTKTYDETILVIKTSEIKDLWQGLKTSNTENFINLINEKKEFFPRSIMELDEHYKQIIPYLVFKFENSIFVMQRKSTASEQRLKNKLSIGIGGHIRKEDISNKSVFEWAKREFHEEIDYNGNLSTKLIGVLNDDSNNVGKVHIGIIFLLNGDSGQIKIKSELKSGTLIPIKEISFFIPKMETWSQIVSNFIISNAL